jgi:cell division protein FtsW
MSISGAPHGLAPQRSQRFYPPVPAKRGWTEAVRIWWREIDKVLLGLIIALMVAGLVASAAASPAGAAQAAKHGENLSDFYYLTRTALFQLAGLAGMLAVSFISRDDARRLAIVVAGVMLVLLVLVPIFGPVRNGARRWLEVGFSLQPSEFLKPAFAVTIAWILSWRLRDASLPVVEFATAGLMVVAALLMLQPNLGDTILFAGIWFVLVLLAGVSVQRIGVLMGLGVAGLTLAYFFYDNARHRIDAFWGGGTAFDQVDLAQRTLMAGGWTGSGLWLGVRKMNLPEAHTDYIFSVIGEEFGLIACAGLVLLYCAVVIRVLIRLVDEENLFTLLAGAGLITGFGGQAFINMLVNLQLFPSKGMTLPLISYGGSSVLAVCFGLGLLLAITRRNPFLAKEGRGLRGLLDSKEERP